jgi:hypothetical protein
MVKVGEAAQTQGTPLEAAIKQGLDTLSLDQTITFYKYVRLVLPLDGFVFWVRANLVSPTAIYNAMLFNGPDFNAGSITIDDSNDSITVDGSLHYAVHVEQTDEENLAINDVVFTAESRIDAFNDNGPNVLYIATPADPPLEGIRFAFAGRGPYYEQADLYHYSGQAIYADMETQIIDTLAGFDRTNVIVSNSLPIWLSMNQVVKRPWINFVLPCQLFPARLSPQNLKPPYGTVNVLETTALQASPRLSKNLSHSQLCEDRVQITLWGLRNFNAMDFVDFVNEFIGNSRVIGLLNMPAMVDDKRHQTELLTLAQKKTIEYQVSYNQEQARNISRQLILHCIPSFIFP